MKPSTVFIALSQAGISACTAGVGVNIPTAVDEYRGHLWQDGAPRDLPDTNPVAIVEQVAPPQDRGTALGLSFSHASSGQRAVDLLKYEAASMGGSSLADLRLWIDSAESSHNKIRASALVLAPASASVDGAVREIPPWGQRKAWYGKYILLIDSVAIASGVAVFNDWGPPALFIPMFFGYVSNPFVHTHHHNYMKGFLSMLTRIMLPAVTAGLGGRLADAPTNQTLNHPWERAGLLVGAIGAAALDAFVWGWKPALDPELSAPTARY